MIKKLLLTIFILSLAANCWAVDANTVTLLHLNGNDASTTITDSSDSAHTFLCSGNAQLDTAIKYFGTASLLLDGTDDFIYDEDSTDWDFGNGEFSVDFWFYLTSDAGVERIIMNQGSYTANTLSWTFSISPNWIYFSYTTNGKIGTYTSIYGAGNFSVNTWYHLAFVRDGNTGYLFKNGTQVASGDMTGITIFNSGSDLNIGSNYEGNNSDFVGSLDEIRISKTSRLACNPFIIATSEYNGQGDDFSCPSRRRIMLIN